MCVVSLLVLVQPVADEGVGRDHVNDGIEAGEDGARVETSTRGASAAETVGDEVEAKANISTEAITTDTATAPEVWVLESGFVFGWVIFVKFKWCTKPV
jgi:hypothetical protein